MWPICHLLHNNKELLALWNNFRATKKFLIAKFDRNNFTTKGLKDCLSWTIKVCKSKYLPTSKTKGWLKLKQRHRVQLYYQMIQIFDWKILSILIPISFVIEKLYFVIIIFRKTFKGHIFWEGHKILQDLHQLFVLCTASQIVGGDFAKFWVLLRIYEL